MLVVGSWLGWGTEKWFLKNCRNLTPNTEICLPVQVLSVFPSEQYFIFIQVPVPSKNSLNKPFIENLYNFFAQVVVHLMTKLTTFAEPFRQVYLLFAKVTLTSFANVKVSKRRWKMQLCHHCKMALEGLESIEVMVRFGTFCALETKMCASWRFAVCIDVFLYLYTSNAELLDCFYIN